MGAFSLEEQPRNAVKIDAASGDADKGDAATGNPSRGDAANRDKTNRNAVDGSVLSYDEKLRLTNRDALRAIVALGVVIAVWLVCGFGLSGFDIKLFHVPLWVVGGLLGTWVAAIVVSVVLARKYQDFDLEDNAPDKGGLTEECTLFDGGGARNG